MILLEYEIKTKYVYLNIIDNENIYTRMLSTEEAVKEYGSKIVLEFEAPEMGSEIVEMPVDRGRAETKYTNGITNIIIKI